MSVGRPSSQLWVNLLQYVGWASPNFVVDLVHAIGVSKSEFIVFVETIKDSVTSSLKISKAIGIYNKFLQNSVLRFNVTVIYAPTINSCK